MPGTPHRNCYCCGAVVIAAPCSCYGCGSITSSLTGIQVLFDIVCRTCTYQPAEPSARTQPRAAAWAPPGSGPSGRSLDLRHEARGSAATLDEVGRLLLNLCRAVPEVRLRHARRDAVGFVLGSEGCRDQEHQKCTPVNIGAVSILEVNPATTLDLDEIRKTPAFTGKDLGLSRLG